MKIIPENIDFNVYWLETRQGRPHPKTGIPPSLYTLKLEDFLVCPGMSYFSSVSMYIRNSSYWYFKLPMFHHFREKEEMCSSPQSFYYAITKI
jgi:hypothetical protein